MMHKLLSVPTNLVEQFYELAGVDSGEWFVTSDPVEKRLGSGGGTAWLLKRWRESNPDADVKDRRRIILHAGGHSRRLPAYASSGKILTPVPVFRWARGQKYDQNLLSLQLPLYERIMEAAPPTLTTLIASGDVYIRTDRPLQPVPEADVVCYGLWVDPRLATRHGVFVSRRSSPEVMEFMLQKPSLDTLGQLASSHYFLMDIGIWLLSDKALALLEKRSRSGVAEPDASRPWEEFRTYDLYTDFGGALGRDPRIADPALNSLKVAVLPLPGGEFYHYGTTRELISSTAAVQNKVFDQRRWMQRRVRPNDTLFVQNTDIGYRLTHANDSVWVENAHVSPQWTLTERNVVTGVPANDWSLRLDAGVCLDVEPVKGETGHVVRPYGFDDPFSGRVADSSTLYLGEPLAGWLGQRGLTPDDIGGDGCDIQQARLFPVVNDIAAMEHVVKWMTSDPADGCGRRHWIEARKLSADDIAREADLRRLFSQRRDFSRGSLEKMAANYDKSVIYQLDLDHVARSFADFAIEPPAPLPEGEAVEKRISNLMLRSRIMKLHGDVTSAERTRLEAIALMREQMSGDLGDSTSTPRLSVYYDQIVWGRSPVRVDLAGGWTDTPPYSLLNGGCVANIAVELNGQPPLQVYVKPSEQRHIVLRSIDMGAEEVVTTYEALGEFTRVGSPFSIPKAALALAGFLPRFSACGYGTLARQLDDFGCGIEITLLSAVPAGSGLGTSSILAATVLGSLSDFCGLGWSENEICRRTLVLEQLLTTGGGWQDQYGGVLPGAKLLTTSPGSLQVPQVDWLPDNLFVDPATAGCHLLYYTGMTRTAKSILSEIVTAMFLNSSRHLRLLADMKQHALETAAAIQRNDFDRFGRMTGVTWQQNCALDPLTCPPAIAKLTAQVSDYCLGYKLPGAGGGGFLYMVAKDSDAALRIRRELTGHAPNRLARFVDISLSKSGFRLSRS